MMAVDELVNTPAVATEKERFGFVEPFEEPGGMIALAAELVEEAIPMI